VSLDAEAAAASMSEQRLHLGDPLGVRRAAEAVAMAEEAGPVVAGAGVAPWPQPLPQRSSGPSVPCQ